MNNGLLVDKERFSNTLNNAKELALHIHGDQLYSRMHYIAHLEDVFEVVNSLYDTDNFTTEELELLHLGAYLHDALEDTSLSVNDIQDCFSHELAYLVYNVSDMEEDDYGNFLTTRKTKHYVTYNAMAELFHSDAGYDLHIALKLADRIANGIFSIVSNNHSMYEMYRKEYTFFRNTLMSSSTKRLENAWKELDQIFQFDSSIYPVRVSDLY
jgi:(p)ppGpp synthase/HD superfamily hydrolase